MTAVMAGWLARLGEEVIRRRAASPHTKQEAFAETIDVSRQQISIIENGRRSYSIGPLLSILSGLNPKHAPDQSLLEITRSLDVLDTDATEAVGNLIGILSGADNEQRRQTAITVLRGLRKDQIDERSGGKGRRHKT